ncbi:MAG: hypothetical protein EVA87_00415 [Rhodospirillaceae bacterium]|nr:MAG: hypothetical protein EVA87_00415 [Rhodospirillaceae bacterium]
MIMSLAVAGLLAASTAAFAGEGDSGRGYQQTVRTGKPTIILGTGKAMTKPTANTTVKMTKPGN